MIWKVKPTLEVINSFHGHNIESYLGIEITEIGDDFISARMPVDDRTKQPLGLLHGGASCVLAETLGSIGGAFCVNPAKQSVLGLVLNANHIRGVRDGYVTGTARPLEISSSTHVWEIRIVNNDDQLVCITRLTLAVRNI